MNIPIAVKVRISSDVTPEQCDHAGQTWSTDLGMRCTKCGVRLFAHLAILAYRSKDVVDEMHRLWQAAGYPHLSVMRIPGQAWVADGWTLVQHPLFAHIGGLPVRNDQLAEFRKIVVEV